jgi:hypothetical protein
MFKQNKNTSYSSGNLPVLTRDTEARLEKHHKKQAKKQKHQYPEPKLEESAETFEFETLVNELCEFAYEKLNLKKPCDVSFQHDEENASNPLGKTAYYIPNEAKIVVYVTNRHPSDIFKSICHELVHYAQDCKGKLRNNMPENGNYAQENGYLRNLEREAYEKGNLIYRDFRDMKENDKKIQEYHEMRNLKASLYENKFQTLSNRLTKRFTGKLNESKLDIKDDIVNGVAEVLYAFAKKSPNAFKDKEIPQEYYYSASMFVEKIELMNGDINLGQYFFENFVQDTHPRIFGQYIALEAVKAGKKWSDEHTPHNLEIPYWTHSPNVNSTDDGKADNGMKASDYTPNNQQTKTYTGNLYESLLETAESILKDIEEMIEAGETKEDIYHQLVRGENMTQEEADKYFQKALKKVKGEK